MDLLPYDLLVLIVLYLDPMSYRSLEEFPKFKEIIDPIRNFSKLRKLYVLNKFEGNSVKSYHYLKNSKFEKLKIECPYIGKRKKFDENLLDVQKLNLIIRRPNDYEKFLLPNLVVLDLSYNSISEFRLRELQNLQNLEYLDLGNNLLTSVPNFSFYLRNLVVLNLTGNLLTSVTYFSLPNLEQLFLGNNKLTLFPDFSLPELKDLDLCENQLTSVPDFSLRLPNLEFIDLCRNQINSVPDFRFSLPKLIVWS